MIKIIKGEFLIPKHHIDNLFKEIHVPPGSIVQFEYEDVYNLVFKVIPPDDMRQKELNKEI